MHHFLIMCVYIYMYNCTKSTLSFFFPLIDMEEKVNITLKIIDDGGDSFAQRAEMYYRKRPEIINFVEESFRAYRALAERYDHLSRELQSANRTIATAFPERVQFAMDVDDHDENNVSHTSTSSSPINPIQSNTNWSSIPKVPKIPDKDFRSPSMSITRKGSPLIRQLASSAKAAAAAVAAAGTGSGLTKTEALEEIDSLQKGILALQTEKEFVKSMYEHGYKKFWEIENQITEMHKSVSSLQDEFGIGSVIEDDEARALMAATALKSCQETLAKLQEKKEKSTEEARIEQQRIREAHERFETLRAKFLPKNTESKSSDEEIASSGVEEHDVEMLRKRIKEQLDLSSGSSLTVTELADKIDDLVNEVVSLETAVSSQTALVKRLGTETDQLQAHVKSLEEDKENLKEGSENMSKRLKILEEEMVRVKELNRSFKVQNNNLQTHFTEASCNLDHLSEKLESMKQDEEVENLTTSQEVGEFSNAEPENDIGENTTKPEARDDLEKKESDSVIGNSEKIEEENMTNQSNNLGEMAIKPEESEAEKEEETGQPNWRQLFLKGLEDREKILLEEYTSVLQDYKEVKKKLSDVENKNRDSIFELALQVRELKSDVASKDEELKSLKRKFEFPPTNPDESPFTCSTEYKYTTNQEASGEEGEGITQAAVSPISDIPSLNLDRDSVSELEDTNAKSLENLIESEDIVKEKHGDTRPDSISTIEEKFRSDIDGLLEENLEFWLRFSTSVHQIQKFETSIEDLHLELKKLKEHKNRKPEGIVSNQHSIQSDARPIYRHLREIQTEMSLWFEHNAVLKDELQGRFSSLCNIQNEISRMSSSNSRPKRTELSDYQAAKFQGEVLNMKQENNKVAEELNIGLNRVRVLKLEVERTLVKLNEELGISAARSGEYSTTKHSPHRPRIPLRSFLFGVKLKRQKPSIFSCVSPALQKQYSDLTAVGTLPSQ